MNSFSARFCRKCLHSSINVENMIRFAAMVNPDYDIYKRSGFREGHPIGSQDAAYRISVDMIQDGYYVDFVELLIRVNSFGFMGSHFAFRGLDDVIGDVMQAGYNFDEATGQFFEDENQQITRSWGRLLDGDERQMAVIRMDIAGNSLLVRENPKPQIDKAYRLLREIIENTIISRLGRLWAWEGDGALGAFMLGNYSSMAIFAGMEILNEMFLFNKTKNPLNSNINLRLSVHSGNLVYSEDEIKCLKEDTVRKAMTLESKAAAPNSLVISESLALSQDQSLLNIFSNTKNAASEKYRIYKVSQD
ncbi:MAG: hypothetical protein FWC97_09020 [Treponema sp.]|nr:hypothetical protein [Treponema sp.]